MNDVLNALMTGRLRDPDSGAVLAVPVRSVIIAPSLAADAAALVRQIDLPRPYAVISDPNTYEALGRQVEAALNPVIAIRLPGRPHPDEHTATEVMRAGAAAGTYIAVGSGTINDLAKYAAYRQGKRCAVFATAPSMNGYTSVNVAITVRGHKKSLPAMAPDGVFIDLDVLAAAPKRLIRAGLGDAICRSTAQCDWYMAHVLRGTSYSETPFSLFADLEDAMVAEAEAVVRGDPAAIERLAKVLVLSGFGMTLCGGSYPASQGEHLISHYIEMTHKPDGDEPLHGEQIAVTTLVMARLQEMMIAGPPPVVRPQALSEAALKSRYGDEAGAACWKELSPKLLDDDAAAAFSALIAQHWPDLTARLTRMLRPASEIAAALGAAGAPRHYTDLGLSRQVFAAAVRHAREIRNRYTFLDLAADSGQLAAERLID
jgi:glycerol-1-phosphate dehydrogenase [NAD(P)+]